MAAPCKREQEASRVGVMPVTEEGPPHGKLLQVVRQARLFPSPRPLSWVAKRFGAYHFWCHLVSLRMTHDDPGVIEGHCNDLRNDGII